MQTTTDRIEKKTVIQAPQSKVWSAITDAAKFSEWFGAKIDGEFAVGNRLACRASCNGTEARFEILVEAIEPETRFVYRWHPNAVDEPVDATTPMTTVVFLLEASPDGTRLTITESGFDRLPADRRAEAFRRNEGGWTTQIERVANYVVEAK